MRCKFCGSTKGYFEKVKLEQSISHHYKFSGETMDEDESEYCIPDSMHFVPASKFIFCAKCERKIGELEDAPHIKVRV